MNFSVALVLYVENIEMLKIPLGKISILFEDTSHLVRCVQSVLQSQFFSGEE